MKPGSCCIWFVTCDQFLDPVWMCCSSSEFCMLSLVLVLAEWKGDRLKCLIPSTTLCSFVALYYKDLPYHNTCISRLFSELWFISNCSAYLSCLRPTQWEPFVMFSSGVCTGCFMLLCCPWPLKSHEGISLFYSQWLFVVRYLSGWWGMPSLCLQRAGAGSWISMESAYKNLLSVFSSIHLKILVKM